MKKITMRTILTAGCGSMKAPVRNINVTDTTRFCIFNHRR